MKKQVIRVLILASIAITMVTFYITNGGDFFGGGEVTPLGPLGQMPIIGVRAPTQPIPTFTPGGTSASCQTTPYSASAPAGSQSAEMNVIGWYHSRDSRIWAGPEEEARTGNISFIWVYPPGQQIIVSGRKLDGSGPFLGATAGSDLGNGFYSNVISFPETGCWQIDAHVGESSLNFIVSVK